MEKMRKLARSKAKHFVLVYVKADLDTCIERDPKGLYEKALKGEIKGYTGIDSPFEQPEQYEILLDTDKYDVLTCANKVTEYIQGVL